MTACSVVRCRLEARWLVRYLQAWWPYCTRHAYHRGGVKVWPTATYQQAPLPGTPTGQEPF